MKDNIPWKLIQKSLAGRITPQEQEELKKWRMQSPKNDRLMEEMRQIWSVQPEERVEVDVDKAWQQFAEDSSSIGKNQKEESEHIASKKDSSSGKWKYGILAAAVVLLGLVMTVWYQGWMTNYLPAENTVDQKPVMAMKVLDTEPGEKAGVTFSDGTRIMLNADSKLKFPQQFSDEERIVYLDGEAYFEVTKNRDLPFIIKTDDAQVRVLGTKFNVQAWKKDRRVSVSVKEGKVSVEKSDTTNHPPKVVLQKNQRVVLEDGQDDISIENLKDQRFMYWLNGGLYFHNTPFPNVIKRLERQFNVSIEIIDEELAAYRYSGAFQKADLEETLKVISVSMNVEFQHRNNQILVEAKTAEDR